MSQSQCEDALVSVRIVTLDHYQREPMEGLDRFMSERGYEISRVPILRICGSTPAGQRAVLHVHGVFPYFYVPVPSKHEKDAGFPFKLASAIDLALNRSLGQNKGIQHVFKIAKVSGRPFYGYHPRKQDFFKIYFYNPPFVKRAADLFHNGNVLNESFQPYESHIPFELQFLMDYHLQGMNLIHFKHAVFRQGQLRDEFDEIEPFFDIKPSSKAPKVGPFGLIKHGPESQSSDDFSNSLMDWSFSQSDEGSQQTSEETLMRQPAGERFFFVNDDMSDSLKLPFSVQRTSTTELEIDAVAADILNIGEGLGTHGMNPGLKFLWEDERERRRILNIDDSEPITPPDSPKRPPEASNKTDSEEFWYPRLETAINEKLELEGDSGPSSTPSFDPDSTINLIEHLEAYEREQAEDDESGLPDATQVESHVQSLSGTLSGQSTPGSQKSQKKSQAFHAAEESSEESDESSEVELEDSDFEFADMMADMMDDDVSGEKSSSSTRLFAEEKESNDDLSIENQMAIQIDAEESSQNRRHSHACDRTKASEHKEIEVGTEDLGEADTSFMVFDSSLPASSRSREEVKEHQPSQGSEKSSTSLKIGAKEDDLLSQSSQQPTNRDSEEDLFSQSPLVKDYTSADRDSDEDLFSYSPPRKSQPSDVADRDDKGKDLPVNVGESGADLLLENKRSTSVSSEDSQEDIFSQEPSEKHQSRKRRKTKENRPTENSRTSDNQRSNLPFVGESEEDFNIRSPQRKTPPAVGDLEEDFDIQSSQRKSPLSLDRGSDDEDYVILSAQQKTPTSDRGSEEDVIIHSPELKSPSPTDRDSDEDFIIQSAQQKSPPPGNGDSDEDFIIESAQRKSSPPPEAEDDPFSESLHLSDLSLSQDEAGNDKETLEMSQIIWDSDPFREEEDEEETVTRCPEEHRSVAEMANMPTIAQGSSATSSAIDQISVDAFIRGEVDSNPPSAQAEAAAKPPRIGGRLSANRLGMSSITTRRSSRSTSNMAGSSQSQSQARATGSTSGIRPASELLTQTATAADGGACKTSTTGGFSPQDLWDSDDDEEFMKYI